MPASEAQKRASKKWRDNHKEQNKMIKDRWIDNNREYVNLVCAKNMKKYYHVKKEFEIFRRILLEL